jgi:glycosidase
MTVPEWVQDAIFYQIFPDRFANGDPSNDPPNVQRWGAAPTTWGFQGGDFQGICDHFDYLVDLGINAIYLNPVFQATTNHRYNATDYYAIDPKLGTLADFRRFLDLAHHHGVRVVLDGVFNHCGRGFFAFNDILENQDHSPYLNWFHVKNFPVDAYGPGDAKDYLGWWGIKGLPKFNTGNPLVRKYLLDVARYWIDLGVDGWRLDVPNEIDDDDFWLSFRQVVKASNPDAYILGEIWTMDRRWVGDAHFDGLMNYPFRDAVLRLLQTGTLDIPHFMNKLEELILFYPPQNNHAMYVPLGSHDTERLMTKLENDLAKVRLALLLQFTFPGAPAVYYGDEIGLTGGKDPDCRAAFPWNESTWNRELRSWVKQLIELRKANSALRRGEFARLCADPANGCCAYLRTDDQQNILVLVNTNPEPRRQFLKPETIGVPNGTVLRSLIYNQKEYYIGEAGCEIVIPAWSGEVLA